MRLQLLLYALLFFLTLLLPVRSGIASAEGHCLSLSGICRRTNCKLIEDEIGGCRRRWKCCRPWWILLPVPTPVIFSEYEEGLKPRLK
ncbi:beta-defensin 109-like [Cavia porcellus]|uniref:beta-defensin 109-like n=1 Tax=Cavia porcellus TaxID=10141 RepID=UPI002FE00F89